MRVRIILVTLVVLTVAACAPDEGATLSCPGPTATGCDSLAEVYERTTSEQPLASKSAVAVPAERVMPVHSEPQLVPPHVLRVWIAPWEDADGDLHDHQYVYLILRPPVWTLGTSGGLISPQPVKQ